MHKFTLSLVVFVLASTIGLGLLFDTFFNHYTENKSNNAQSEYEYVEALFPLIIDLSSELTSTQLSELTSSKENIRLTIESPKHVVLPLELVSLLDSGETLSIEDVQTFSLIKKLPERDALIQLSLHRTSPKATLSHFRFGITLLFYVLLAVLISVWLLPLIKRLLKLRQATQLFGNGYLAQRIEVSRVSYIQDIERDFNLMAQRIENLVADVKLLSNAVSHDLRTPLAKIRMGFDTLCEEQDETKRQNYAAKINLHIDHMQDLVETLLAYARLDNAKPVIGERSVQLHCLLKDIVSQHDHPHKQITLELQNASVPGDRKYLSIALNNLLQNATTYAKHHITLALSSIGNNTVITISDDGPGLGSAVPTDIFKPFVKGTDSSGFGMGLAITQRILQWHYATIAVDQSPELRGARFTVTFS